MHEIAFLAAYNFKVFRGSIRRDPLKLACQFSANRSSALISSSETQGLLAEPMRYFRAKVYFKCWRAPGKLFLPNQFQKWSNSVPLIGQKKKFSAQSARSSSRVTLSLSYTKQFSSSIDLVAWPVQREGYRGEFQKRVFNEAEEIASLNMGARNQYFSINFLGGFIESIS